MILGIIKWFFVFLILGFLVTESILQGIAFALIANLLWIIGLVILSHFNVPI